MFSNSKSAERFSNYNFFGSECMCVFVYLADEDVYATISFIRRTFGGPRALADLKMNIVSN